MNIKRALGFSLLVYLAGFILYLIIEQFSAIAFPKTSGYIAFWILNIPVVLFFAKWYFKNARPTTGRGLQLGIFAAVVAILLDLLFFLLAKSTGTDTTMFEQFFSDWKYYATFLEIIILGWFAGYEFDATYSGKK